MDDVYLGSLEILQVELQFEMPEKVHAIAMSSIAATHMLVAAGTEDVRIRLCDLASGACTHTLSGHRGNPLSHYRLLVSMKTFVLHTKVLP